MRCTSEEKRCIIVGAGEYYGRVARPRGNDLVIAADGGLVTLNIEGITPDFIIGDFDSLGHIPDADNVIKLSCVKDTTDMFEAVRLGLENGCGEFLIYGGTGGRTEHTLANIQTAVYLSKRYKSCYIFDRKRTITALTDGTASFDGKFRGFISVFAADTTVGGVTENGLKYSLDGAELVNDFPVGVSNEFSGTESAVSVKKGTLIIVFDESDGKLPLITINGGIPSDERNG